MGSCTSPSHWAKVSDVIKQAPRVHDWNVSNISQRWRPILPPDWEQSSRELMIVKWGQTAETEGGRQREEGGCEGAKVITLSLVHCCLLSDLIWSRRHTWAKAHPSQVLQDPSIACSPLPSIHPSFHSYLSLSFSPNPTFHFFQGSLSLSPPICPDLSQICSLHLTLSDYVQSLSPHPSLLCTSTRLHTYIHTQLNKYTHKYIDKCNDVVVNYDLKLMITMREQATNTDLCWMHLCQKKWINVSKYILEIKRWINWVYRECSGNFIYDTHVLLTQVHPHVTLVQSAGPLAQPGQN